MVVRNFANHTGVTKIAASIVVVKRFANTNNGTILARIVLDRELVRTKVVNITAKNAEEVRSAVTMNDMTGATCAIKYPRTFVVIVR